MRHAFELTRLSREWLLPTSPHTVADKLTLQFLEWRLLEQSEEFVRSGKPLELHETLGDGRSGTWPPATMPEWPRAAGLTPARPPRPPTLGGIGLQSATKPG